MYVPRGRENPLGQQWIFLLTGIAIPNLYPFYTYHICGKVLAYISVYGIIKGSRLSVGLCKQTFCENRMLTYANLIEQVPYIEYITT